MMGDHEDGIPNLSSPLYVDDGEFTPTLILHLMWLYIMSLILHSSYDPSFTGHLYQMLGDETHHEPVSTSYVSYGMFGNPIHDTNFFF